MVKKSKPRSGFAVAELVLAMAIITIAMFPMALIFSQEQKLLRNSYQRAVAMEIIDGEMEILQAGEWRAFSEGAQPYSIRAGSVSNLPPATVTLTIVGKHLRLDWRPAKKSGSGEIIREVDVR